MRGWRHGAFVEQDVYGLTVRARVGNAFSVESDLRRTGFAGRRTGRCPSPSGVTASIYSLEIRGKF